MRFTTFLQNKRLVNAVIFEPTVEVLYPFQSTRQANHHDLYVVTINKSRNLNILELKQLTVYNAQNITCKMLVLLKYWFAL